LTTPELYVASIFPQEGVAAVRIDGLQIAGDVIEGVDSSNYGARITLTQPAVVEVSPDRAGGHLILEAGKCQGFQESGVDIKVPDLDGAALGQLNSTYAKMMIPTQFPLSVSSSGLNTKNDLLTVTLPLGRAASLWLAISVVAQSSDPTSILAASNSRMLQLSLAHTNSKFKLNMVSSGIAAASDIPGNLVLNYTLSAVGDVVTLSAFVGSNIASPVAFADLVLISHTGAPVQFLDTGARAALNAIGGAGGGAGGASAGGI
jgi:hypothetical protein